MTFQLKLLLVSLFLFFASCAPNPESPNAPASQNRALDVNSSEVCGRLFFPKYIDVDNQLAIDNEIQSQGTAHLILHFHEAGQAAIDAFLQKTEGVLKVGYEWPDWSSMSLIVSEKGLRQLQEDCTIELIEADKVEHTQNGQAE